MSPQPPPPPRLHDEAVLALVFHCDHSAPGQGASRGPGQPGASGGWASAADLLQRGRHSRQPPHELDLVSMRTVDAPELGQQAEQLCVQKPSEVEVRSARGRQGKRREIWPWRAPS